MVPAVGIRRGGGAGLAPCCSRLGLLDGVVPGGSLRHGLWAVCPAVGFFVWTRSLTLPVSGTVCLWTGDSASAQGLFRVDAHTRLFRSEAASPGSARVCACGCVLPCVCGCTRPSGWCPGRVGRAGLPDAFCCALPFLLPYWFSLTASRLRVPLLCFSFAPLLCLSFRCFRPWALGLSAL